ncbi:MAG: helix-turn-helix transcriptional regulator [Oscillospiraceae bacterium]|nr:helix-turn-helix transcriptional regulator [Oscillospiraceae bacterium]
MDNFKERLKICRKNKNVTQIDVSNSTGIAYSTYRRYERSAENGGTEPTLSDFVKLADYFGVSLDYLAGRSDE